MGWERRGNRQHFYTARRVGGRVVKEYVPDVIATLTAQLEAEQRAESDAGRAAVKQALAELDALAAAITPLDEFADLVLRAALVASGYHRHKGQWRKRRG